MRFQLVPSFKSTRHFFGKRPRRQKLPRRYPNIFGEMFFKSGKVLVHVSRRRKDPSFWYSLDSYQKEWKGNEILRNLFKTIFTLCCGLLLLLLYCRPLSFLFSFKSLFRLFFLIRDFPHAECVFLFFLLYDPFHRHNNNTHSAAAARVCWASFLVIVEVGRRFFRSIFVRNPTFATRSKCENTITSKNEDKWEHA
jgi:hypothetical protein